MKKIKKLMEKDSFSAWLYLAPALILLGIFTFYPTIQLIINSFFEMDGMGTKNFLGTDNYTNLLQDEEFWNTVKNSFEFILWSVPLGMVAGLGLALLINKSIRGKGVFRTIFFSPVVTSLVAAGLIWVWLLNYDYGIINVLLGKFGIENIPWLVDERFAMPSVITMTVWKDAGYNMILFLAGLNGINATFYEAAEIDGATKWAQFKYITWPLLMPTTLFVLVIRTIFSFRTFEQIFAMTKGGPTGSTTVFVYYIYEKAFNNFELGYASAAAVILLIIVLSLTFIQFKITGKKS